MNLDSELRGNPVFKLRDIEQARADAEATSFNLGLSDPYAIPSAKERLLSDREKWL